MSKRINVNPGQYKVAGRERPGEDVVTELEKQQLAQEEANRARRRRGKGGANSGLASGGKGGSGGGQK